MSAALVASTAKQSTDGNAVTTNSIDTTGATLLVLGIVFHNAVGVGSVSDSKGNTWVLGPTIATTSFSRINQYYVKAPAVGSGHTFSGGQNGNFPAVFVAAFSGTDQAAGRDGQNAAETGEGGGTTLQPGSVTPTVDGEVLATILGGHSAAAVYSIGSGFTITDQFPIVDAIAYGGALAYLIQGTAGAINPTWTSSVPPDVMQAGIDTFAPWIPLEELGDSLQCACPSDQPIVSVW